MTSSVGMNGGGRRREGAGAHGSWGRLGRWALGCWAAGRSAGVRDRRGWRGGPGEGGAGVAGDGSGGGGLVWEAGDVR